MIEVSELRMVVLLLYGASLVFAILYGSTRKKYSLSIAYSLISFGFIFHTIHIIFHWNKLGYIPATTLSEILSFLSWIIILIFFISSLLRKGEVILPFFMPVITIIYGLSIIIPQTIRTVKGYYHSLWFAIHITLLLSGIALFMASFIYASTFLAQDLSLRKKKPLIYFFPSLQRSSNLSNIFLLIGFPIFTLDIISSMVYGILYGNRKNWHPGLLEIAAVVTWILLAFAIYGRITSMVSTRRKSYIIVIGAALSILIILGIAWHGT